MSCSLNCGSAAWNKRLQSSASRSFELLSSNIARSMCLRILVNTEGRPSRWTNRSNAYGIALSWLTGTVSGGGTTISLAITRAPLLSAGIRHCKILMQYLSDQS